MTRDKTAAPRLSLRQLIWICLGAITMALIVSTAFSMLERGYVTQAMVRLSRRVLPAQEQVAALNTAYVDQETGQRGFMLTADQAFLSTYDAGKAQADRLVAKIRVTLAGDDEANRRLDAVVAAATEWTTQAAEPQIAARRAGPIPPEQLQAMTVSGKRFFDELRARLSVLGARASELIAQQLHRVHAAQKLANVVQGAAALLLMTVVIIAVWLLHRFLTRPVNSVLHDVTAVAEGDYDRAIRSAGLREVAVLADAAETMRDNLRANTTRLLDAERRDEQARIAADLHDRTIQRVFRLGLEITSAAQRRSPDLRPFVDETDRIIADLRGIVFNLNVAANPSDNQVGLCNAIIKVVEDRATDLGFTPDLEFSGPIDERAPRGGARTETLAVLNESLANIGRHAKASAATIHVATFDSRLRLIVRDNGIGSAAVDPGGDLGRDIRQRAEQLGGYGAIRNADEDGGTIVEWVIPLASDRD